MSNLALYMIGVVLVIAGIGYGLYRVGVPPIWIGIVGAVVVGAGLMGGIAKTRRRESPEGD